MYPVHVHQWHNTLSCELFLQSFSSISSVSRRSSVGVCVCVCSLNPAMRLFPFSSAIVQMKRRHRKTLTHTHTYKTISYRPPRSEVVGRRREIQFYFKQQTGAQTTPRSVFCVVAKEAEELRTSSLSRLSTCLIVS